MKYFSRVGLVIVLISLSTMGCTKKKETVLEKTETITNEVVDSVKSTSRDAEDEVCEMINGKLECVAKKAVHKGETLVDKVETKAIETKNKVD